MAKNKKCYSGIGGQAVLEGVMMKNGEKYAVAVRKPDGNIAIDIENYSSLVQGKFINKIPFVRGIFNFVDSMILGMRALNYSTSFYDEETEKEAARDSKHVSTSSNSNAASVIVSVISIIVAVGLFVILPTFITSLFDDFVKNNSLKALIEGAVRIIIFLAYIILISLMKDIRRLYQYHGAEHKCINCIESGKELTVKNVMRSSRLHKRCGTSFLFLVVFISVIIFFFINVDTMWMRFLIRIAMIPVVAGIAYEVLRLAGKYDNVFINIISAPGFLIQKITTKEPDEDMVSVAIASVEAVFDWKTYLSENFGDDNKGENVGDENNDRHLQIRKLIEDEIKEEEEEYVTLHNVDDDLTDIDDWEDD